MLGGLRSKTWCPRICKAQPITDSPTAMMGPMPGVLSTVQADACYLFTVRSNVEKSLLRLKSLPFLAQTSFDKIPFHIR